MLKSGNPVFSCIKQQIFARLIDLYTMLSYFVATRLARTYEYLGDTVKAEAKKTER
jgi:hypothetical protein